jgi:hypothetical protein
MFSERASKCPWKIFGKGLTYGERERLLLNGLLQLDVVLVGHVQRHLEVLDLDVQLLLDAGHLGLQLHLSLHDARVELLDLDARLFAANMRRESKNETNLVAKN